MLSVKACVYYVVHDMTRTRDSMRNKKGKTCSDHLKSVRTLFQVEGRFEILSYFLSQGFSVALKYRMLADINLMILFVSEKAPFFDKTFRSWDIIYLWQWSVHIVLTKSATRTHEINERPHTRSVELFFFRISISGGNFFSQEFVHDCQYGAHCWLLRAARCKLTTQSVSNQCTATSTHFSVRLTQPCWIVLWFDSTCKIWSFVNAECDYKCSSVELHYPFLMIQDTVVEFKHYMPCASSDKWL